MPFEFIKQEIQDVILIKPKVFEDNRGFFMESYKKSDFFEAGIKDEFNQDNCSKSTKGVLRGLHYQVAPMAQSKMVRCTKGRVFDVAVDLRENSSTCGKWVGVELSEENKHIFYVPEGFAHGFVVLSDEAELYYKTSNEYSAQHERGILWNDPDLNIDWNIDFDPIVSDKDKLQPLFRDLKEKICNC